MSPLAALRPVRHQQPRGDVYDDREPDRECIECCHDCSGCEDEAAPGALTLLKIGLSNT